MSASLAVLDKINDLTGLNLTLDNNNAVTFNYKQRNVLLKFEEELNVCLLYCEIGVLEAAALEKALPAILEANYMLYDTKGGSLSFLRENKLVSISFMLPFVESVSPDSFVNQINNALNIADEWYEKIQNFNNSALSALEERLRQLHANGEIAENGTNLQYMNGMNL